jgi:hypothetical protein
MKNFSIHSGNFSQAGNFTGYTALGESVFIHKAQMNSLGWKENAEVKFPFYAIGGIKLIGQLDANGNPAVNADGTPVQRERVQAFSVFPTKDAMISAHVDTATLDIEVKSAIKQSATSAGLSEQAVNSLLELA